MAGLLIFAVAAALAFLNAVFVRLLLRRQANRRWWYALAVAWFAGVGLGVWGNFFFEYQPTPKLRVFGVPVPCAVLKWEGSPGEEQWVDYVVPAPLLIAASNVIVIALTGGILVGLVSLLWRRFLPAPSVAGPESPPVL